MEQIKNRVLEVLKNFSFYQFNEKQIEILCSKVNAKGVISYYEEGFITSKEADNMILHIASELANSFPNKGSFPKPPKRN